MEWISSERVGGKNSQHHLFVYEVWEHHAKRMFHKAAEEHG